jgi:hypothetical protein
MERTTPVHNVQSRIANGAAHGRREVAVVREGHLGTHDRTLGRAVLVMERELGPRRRVVVQLFAARPNEPQRRLHENMRTKPLS